MRHVNQSSQNLEKFCLRFYHTQFLVTFAYTPYLLSFSTFLVQTHERQNSGYRPHNLVSIFFLCNWRRIQIQDINVVALLIKALNDTLHTHILQNFFVKLPRKKPPLFLLDSLDGCAGIDFLIAHAY